MFYFLKIAIFHYYIILINLVWFLDLIQRIQFVYELTTRWRDGRGIRKENTP